MVHIWGVDEIFTLLLAYRRLDKMIQIAEMTSRVYVGCSFIDSLQSCLHFHKVSIAKVDSEHEILHVVSMSLFLLRKWLFMLHCTTFNHSLRDNWDEFVGRLLVLHGRVTGRIHVDRWQHPVSESESWAFPFTCLVIHDSAFYICIMLHHGVFARLDTERTRTWMLIDVFL